ncbi:MAG: O-antigen ligase family protein [Desulfobacterales bacterium]|nr:O-antigen ligase family protein [Desulfobacterales bacterium]
MTVKLKDYQLLIALLLISFVSVYFTPAIVNRVIFIVILAAAYKTKGDYIYLVWFFIINDAPGRLFSAGTFESARIPLYPIMGGISISFQELFILLYIFKYLSLKRLPLFIFKREFTWFLIFGIIVAIISFPLGMGFDNLIRTFRFLLPWTMVIVIPTFIYNRKILIRASLLIFPMVFLAFFSQIFSYFTNNYFDHFLRGRNFGGENMFEGMAARFYSAMYIILFCIVQALNFIFNRKTEINKNYLGSVVFVGLFTILLTASRGWIIASFVLLLGVLILFGLANKITIWLRLVLVSVVIFWIASYKFPILQQQMDASYRRLTTIEALAQGDLTAGGTLKRLDVRGPRVMKKFWESPLFGWGFTDDYYDFQDGHVGNQNILLNIGILGYIFVTGLFINICLKIWKLARKKEILLYEGKTPLLFILGLIFVFIIHASSTQFWGYPLSLDKILFFSIFFAAANAAILYRD